MPWQSLEVHTTSNCLHFVSQVGTQVRDLPPSHGTSQPQNSSPAILSQLDGPRKGTSDSHFQQQVATDSQLQILPGDEIVQINEQVVVSEEEMDMVGRKEILRRAQGSG